MDTDAKYVWVGGVVSLLIIATFAAALWLSEFGFGEKTVQYTVYFKNHTLDGLQIDSNVTMKGIKVGSVVDLQVAQQNIELVKVTVKLDDGTPVKTNTKALIKRNLLTGLARIDLVGGTQEAAVLSFASFGEEFPVIPEGVSDLDQIADSIPGLVEDVSEILARVNAFLSEENRDSVRNILVNLESLSVTLAESREDIDLIIKDIKIITGEIRGVGESFADFASNADRKVTEMSEGAAAALGRVQSLIEKLDERIGGISRTVTGSVKVLTQQFGSLSQRVNEAALSVSSTAESFEDPQQIIGGPADKALGPGEGILR